MHLQEGTAYVKFAGAKGDEFTLMFAHQKLSLAHSAHLRIEMADTTATLAVFSGDVQAEGESGTLAVSKNHTASFDLTHGDRYTLAKNLEPDPFDAWDKQQDQYHQQYANNSYSSYSPYAYGTSDLNYYGNFSNVPGYGTVWQPYFAGAGWDPFMNGAWAFAPGFGYGWVSAYPWGWTPYHYGAWVYCPATDGVAARRLLGRMEWPKGRPPAVEFRFATASVKFRPRNDRREPWSGAGPTREIVQPAGNLQELGGTGDSARGYQELEPAIEHSPRAGICHGKTSHRALGDQLVARWQLCTSLADGRMAWRWRLQCLSRTFQFGSFQCSLEPQRGNDDPTITAGRLFLWAWKLTLVFH